MKADCFFLIFNSPHIVDKIRSYLPKYTKNTEFILSNCCIPSGSLNYLSYDEFLVYCTFLFGYQDILKINKIHINVSPKLVDIIAEENKYDILQNLYTYHITPLKNSIYNHHLIYGTYRSIISAIKHNNLKLLKMLHRQLNITFSNINTQHNRFYNNLYIQDIIVNTLKIAIRVGNVNILQYVCNMIDIYNNEIEDGSLDSHDTHMSHRIINDNKKNVKRDKFEFNNAIFNKLLKICIDCYNIDCAFYLVRRYTDLLYNLTNIDINSLTQNLITSSTYMLHQHFEKSFLTNLPYLRELNYFKTVSIDQKKAEINYILENINHILHNTVLKNELKLKYIISNIHNISQHVDLDKEIYTHRYTYIYKKTTYNDIITEIIRHISYRFNELYSLEANDKITLCHFSNQIQKDNRKNIIKMIPKYNLLYQIIKNKNIYENEEGEGEEGEEGEEDEEDEESNSIFTIEEISEVLTQICDLVT